MTYCRSKPTPLTAQERHEHAEREITAYVRSQLPHLGQCAFQLFFVERKNRKEAAECMDLPEAFVAVIAL